jgi:hypothetical protein
MPIFMPGIFASHLPGDNINLSPLAARFRLVRGGGSRHIAQS